MSKVYYKVTLSHAVGDERGKSTNGTAGDQLQNADNTRGEVRFQDWYVSGKKWDMVLRCKDQYMRSLIAEDGIKGARNGQIGYDQNQRCTLYDNVAPFGFDCSATTKAVECDCSALVTVCANYAGIAIPRDTYTGNMKARYMNTKLFKCYTSNKYTLKPDYLKVGDILVREYGHTAIVVNTLYHLTHPLEYKEGTLMRGDDVKALQCRLNQLEVVNTPLTIDGVLGKMTSQAIKEFQFKNNLDVDGIVGRCTATALGFLYC